MSFSETLKYLREEKNVTQKDIAKACCLTPTCISQLETGARNPTGSTIKALALYFGCSADYLLEIEDDFGNVAPVESTLTEDEQRLLKAFNSLSDVAKRKLIDDAEFYAGNATTSLAKTIKK